MKHTWPGHILFGLLTLTFNLGGHFALAADPAVDLKPIDEKQLQTELPKATRGTIVNLWASWCEPCKREMPELLKYAAKERAKGVRLMLISGDSKDEAKDAAAILAKMKFEPPVYILADAPDVFMKAFLTDWPAIVPTTMLFDKNGKRTAYWLGELKMKELEKAVGKL